MIGARVRCTLAVSSSSSKDPNLHQWNRIALDWRFELSHIRFFPNQWLRILQERAFNHNFSVICLTHRDAGRLHESSKALEQPTSSPRRSKQENCRAERQTVENIVCCYWFVVFLLASNHNTVHNLGILLKLCQPLFALVGYYPKLGKFSG